MAKRFTVVLLVGSALLIAATNATYAIFNSEGATIAVALACMAGMVFVVVNDHMNGANSADRSRRRRA